MLLLNGKKVEIKQFPNGESYIDILEEESLSGLFGNMFNHLDTTKEITLNYENDLDIMGLLYLTDYLKEKGEKVALKMPYIPYSRMDRKENNRLFTLKSVSNLINSMGFEKVTVMEPHSDVSTALLDNVEVINMTYNLTLSKMVELLGSEEFGSKEKLYQHAEDKGIYLVYPDAGASKRYGNQFKYKNVIECNKKRDFETGRITELELATKGEFVDCKIAIIVDDLCSKGGTFIMTAKALREKGIKEIYLVVTHCEDNIFNGELLNTDLIQDITTTDSILTRGNENEKLRVYIV